MAMDDDKYIVIGVQDHCSIIQENDDVIRKIQEFINDEMRNVVRANCLRRYLEGAIDLLIKDKVLAAGLPEEKWNNYNLNICQHLKQLKNGEYQRDGYRYFVVKDA